MLLARALVVLTLLLASLAASIAPVAASQDDGCSAFSEIYAPIDEPAQFWRARGGIRREDIDACRADLRYRSCATCAHRLMVLDNRLYMHLDSLGGNMHARYETALFMMINALRDAVEVCRSVVVGFFLCALLLLPHSHAHKPS
jgi:hypothetical protein